MRSVLGLVVAASIYKLTTAAVTPLTACPGTELTYNGTDRTIYAVCGASNFQSNNINTQSASDFKACADLCLPRASCSFAVFDPSSKNCYLKGSPSSPGWVSDQNLITIRATGIVPEGAVITACPWKETVVTTSTGSTMRICNNTDFQQQSSSWTQIPTQAGCVEKCAKTSGCTQAVWDHVATWCHMKTGGYTWVVSATYDTIRVATTPPNGSPISACPTSEMQARTPDGSTYLICNNADYRGTSLSWSQVPNQAACIDKCRSTNGCNQAVYDILYNWCHIKGAPSTLQWITSTQYSTIRYTGNTPSTNYNIVGKWSAIIPLPVIPVQAFVVPEQPISNRLLLFSSYAPEDFGGDSGLTQFADYNWKSGAVSARQVSNTKHDMFCPGMSALPDGRLVITGGDTAAATSIYDPKTNSFTRGADMNIPRGYQASTTLSNGKIFAIGGSFSGGIGGKTGEIYDPSANKWTTLTGADVTPMLTSDAAGAWRFDNHGWLFGWKNGAVFQAGPSKTMHWYNTAGSGSVSAAGTRWANHDQMCGVTVMYDAVAGKIFSAGGSQDYTDSDAFNVAHIMTISDAYQPVTVEQVANMSYARGFANGAVLPDGTILISGGQQRSLVFTDTNAVMTPELFNPVAKTFTSMANMAVPRNYHSVALLLSDGTVFTGGGGMCYVSYGNSDAGCDRSHDHPDGQIFSPPYLFNADGTLATRPVISSVSGQSIRVGGTLIVAMGDNSGATFSLIRIGSATHSVNTDQRRIPLNAQAQGSVYSMTLPSDTGVLIPGYYYLFAINSHGVPGIAQTIQITA